MLEFAAAETRGGQTSGDEALLYEFVSHYSCLNKNQQVRGTSDI